MTPREGKLVYDRREDCYVLHGCPLREGDPLDILAGTTWIAGHVGYEPSDESWYCDVGLMSIPLYHGREARIRLELLGKQQPDQELRPDEVKMWDDQQDREVRRWLGPPKFRDEEE